MTVPERRYSSGPVLSDSKALLCGAATCSGKQEHPTQVQSEKASDPGTICGSVCVGVEEAVREAESSSGSILPRVARRLARGWRMMLTAFSELAAGIPR